jgi:hypothetical protein
MQGEVLINDWKVALEGDEFDPKLGIGRVLIGSDGLPAYLIWIHVDDIFLHGPTREKYTSALKKILDLTVFVGLICHPTKLKPPAQIQKLCGFLYDSMGTPKLRIPDNKVIRALSLLDFIMRDSRTVICHLALAVVVGTLQPLVPATPNAIGASFLHHVYRNIHNETLDNFDDIGDFYHSGLALEALAQADFIWWEQALNSGLREQVQPRDFCTLGVAWGDGSGSGSGSGSGGTFEWVDSGKGVLPKMDSWMGAWNGAIHSFTSNWRNLGTVVETLKREEVIFNKIRGRMVFYFTYNEFTYNICKKGSSKTLSLHILVQQLKALELALGCSLEVIHVPGTTMMTQGTNGLSRGVWENGFNTDFKSFAVEFFLPDLPSLSLTQWAISHIGIQTEHAAWWNVETDTSSWAPQKLMHAHTFWVLSPGVARQGFTAAIMAWVESPWDSSHLFLVPRIQQRSFGRVNKHVEFVMQFKEIPWGRTHSPLVPFVLYYLPHFVCSLKTNRDDGMDPSSRMRAPQWVRDQVEHLGGL